MQLPRFNQRFIVVIYISICLLFLYYIQLYEEKGGKSIGTFATNEAPSSIAAITRTEKASLIDWRRLSETRLGRMSALGRWLISPENTDPPKPRDPNSSRKYLILIWKYGPTLELRHLKHFTSETFSPWEDCSVKNCRLSYESGDAEEADAILFHLHRIKGISELPKDIKSEIRIRQRWVFLTDESPFHTFLGGNQRLSNYNGIFNWSMTYRMDSDVPVPYGRTLLIKNEKESGVNSIADLLKAKTKLVTMMASNCGGKNQRWDYAKKLKDALGEKFYVYGHCLNGDTESCPGHFAKDCEPLKDYKFYLAFENSNCREYITEKPFWHGYGKNSVPVIMGASRENCGEYLPPKSFIHVDDFANANTLADYLLYLDKNDAEYSKFHEWRRDFKVLNEHGYFQSVSRHYCRLCEALNYNDPSPKVYDKLEEFWNPEKDCW